MCCEFVVMGLAVAIMVGYGVFLHYLGRDLDDK